MSENIFEKFNEMFNVEDLAKSVEEANAASKPFEKKEIPFGDYEIKVTRLAVAPHQFEGDYEGMPELQVRYTIINHPELAGQTLFVNKKLVSLDQDAKERNRKTAFLIHKANEILEALESGITIKFDDFEQYRHLVDTIFNTIDGRAEYHLNYFENAKGFKDYVILEKFQQD